MHRRYGALPLIRVGEEEVAKPCSGQYEGGNSSVEVELIVDIDKTRKFTPVLGIVSGTVSVKRGASKPWSEKADAVYFKVIPLALKVTVELSNSCEVRGDVKAVFTDGTKIGGHLSVKLAMNSGAWKADMELQFNGQGNVLLRNLEKKSEFFKHIKLDIDFTEKLILPSIVLKDLRDSPASMTDRKLDLYSAFEDAGLKLHFEEKQSNKVDDPTPHNPWTKHDLYEAMMNYFDECNDAEENIWCMMGTVPPDKRYMGFSFDRKARRGFAIFTSHRSFKGLKASCQKRKAEAQRRLLHYLVHECGHCLGLKHPFEIGAPDSLSWMNYAWRYDIRRDAGSFYENFQYSFSDQELVILRHAPAKAFRVASSADVLSAIMGDGYSPKSEAPDAKLAEDDDDYDVESAYDQEDASKPKKPRPMRKIALDLKVQTQYSRGQLLSFEARVKNQGKLPALIEGDLSLESGNLQLYLTKPDGKTEVVEPFVRPIQSGYTKPHVLYTSEDEEGADRYSELVTVGEGSDGYQINQPGIYELRAVYTGGRYKTTSESYAIEVVDDDEDKDTTAEILTAATLQASTYRRFQKALSFWQKLDTETVVKKKARVSTLISVMAGMTNDHGRQLDGSVEKTRRGKRSTSYSTSKPALERQKLLQDTSDLVEYYQTQGAKADNMDYSNLVMARGKLYAAEKNEKDADAEFNQMLNDLVGRGVKYDVLSKLSKRWYKVKKPSNVAEKYGAANLQNKVNSVLNWTPSTYGEGEPDLSGIGLGRPFSNFDIAQTTKAERIVKMLFTKYDETQDIAATISYAEKLQKGREVNHVVLRWAVEAFIVHSLDAKIAGIKYPEPEYRDESLDSSAAMVVTKREGQPQEDWMNYWRCDADFNYHHRHWHLVYQRHDGEKQPQLKRRGELFGYMHSQMLARYDAERESWSLPPVKPWKYQETSTKFNAGREFHDDYQYFAPRPEQKWPKQDIAKFSKWEGAYKKAVETREVAPGVEMTPNWSGHVLEPSSGRYSNRFGRYHNKGHVVFGKELIPHGGISYMSFTETAVRDPIFFRWHKKIDDLWQMNNDHYRSELTDKAPLVTITADDIILSNEAKPPVDFGKMSYGKWLRSKAPAEVACLKTYLGPARKKYEWDNKLSHEKFYYHLRLKRNTDTKNTEDMDLTIRIFICPKKRQQERRRWIEMDKFVCKIPAGEDYVVLTRADVYSSVIKRLHETEYVDEVEKTHVDEAHGFCDCGWPYHMLLPRGKKNGEDYVICVIATDNRIDSIGIRTSCGSMSYCGAMGEKYPDSRNMGYPFSNPITYKDEAIPIPEVFDKISNAAYKTFQIKNDAPEPLPMKAIDCWWPYSQLKVNDGTLFDEPEGGVTEYIRSNLVGKFRVLIDNNALRSSRSGKLLVRFQGRGAGGGPYVICNVTLALRESNTLETNESQKTKVCYQGKDTFIVPEAGLISDPVEMSLDPAKGDYFLTFNLESGGVYLPSSQKSQTSTYFIPAEYEKLGFSDSKGRKKYMQMFADIHCVSGIMAKMQGQAE